MKRFAVYQHDSLPPAGFKLFRLLGSNESFQPVQAVKTGFSWPGFFLALFLTYAGALAYCIRIRSGKLAIVVLVFVAVLEGVAVPAMEHAALTEKEVNALLEKRAESLLENGVPSAAHNGFLENVLEYIFPSQDTLARDPDFWKTWIWIWLVGVWFLLASFYGFLFGAIANRFRARKLLDSGYRKIGETEAESKADAVAKIEGIPAIIGNPQGETA